MGMVPFPKSIEYGKSNITAYELTEVEEILYTDEDCNVDELRDYTKMEVKGSCSD